MRTHTQDFKTKIKDYGRQFNDTIYYNNNTYDGERINSVNYSVDTSLMRSVMQTLKIDTDLPLTKGDTIDYGISLEGVTGSEIRFNNFIVDKVDDQKDKNSKLVTCYDNMIKTMVDYTPPGVTYPVTIRNYINAICTHLGITFKNASSTFTNYNKQITSEHYVDTDGNSLGYTFRDVLDDLAEATGSFICIDNTGKLEIRSVTNTNDTIDEEYFKDKNVTVGAKYGPINVVILSRGDDSDNLYRPSTLPVTKNEIKITDNPILDQDNREDFIDGIYNQLNGLEYYTNDFATNGILYYEVGDKFNVSIDNTTYSCLMLADNIKRTTGLSEKIYTKEPSTSVSDYKYASDTDKLEKTSRNAWIKANKAEGTAEMIVQGIGSNGQVTGASVIASINGDSSNLTLNADKINLNGAVTANNNFKIKNDGSVEINNGSIDLIDNGQSTTQQQCKITITAINEDYLNSIYSWGSQVRHQHSDTEYGIDWDDYSNLYAGGFLSAREETYNNEKDTYISNLDANSSYTGLEARSYHTDTQGNQRETRKCHYMQGSDYLPAISLSYKGNTIFEVSNRETYNYMNLNGNATISGNTTIGGDVVVGSIETKNRFNKNDVNVGYFSSNGSIQINSNYRYSNYIDVLGYNKITISGISNTGTAHIIEYNASKQYVDFWGNRNQTITLNANTKYIRVSMHINDLNTYQVEKGSTATSYTPYQELNNHEYYTTGEQAIGTWVNGKTLYRKVINIGNLPNATTKTISTGLSNITPINLYGYGYNPNTDVMFMVNSGNPAGLSFQIQAYYSSGSILIQTGVDRSAYSGYIVLEYIKN